MFSKRRLFFLVIAAIFFTQAANAKIRNVVLDPCPGGGNETALIVDENDDGRFDWAIISDCDGVLWVFKLGFGPGVDVKIGRIPAASGAFWFDTPTRQYLSGGGYTEHVNILSMVGDTLCGINHVYGNAPTCTCAEGDLN